MSQFHQKNMIGKIEIFIGKEYKNIHTVEIESNACTFMAAIKLINLMAMCETGRKKTSTSIQSLKRSVSIDHVPIWYIQKCC